MNKIKIIQTNLNRAIVLGITAVLVALFFYWINKSIGTLIILIIIVGVFLLYVFSKKTLRIIVDEQIIRFEFLQGYKKEILFDRSLIEIKKRVEVHFRGGKNEVFEIYKKNTGEKITQISKRAFKSENDYLMFKRVFEIDAC